MTGATSVVEFDLVKAEYGVFCPTPLMPRRA